uniref:NADH dehydrogenase subunit 6 n=1 Tax=Caenorhabditis sp. TaxID=56638 RepID=A0A1Z1GDC5_9PELO|nr:NADH dehydrogenase subunit 6 [Caenorhabditis sp.]
MFKFFFIFSLVSCMLSYISIDPMKSSFFLILSLLFTMPILSFGMHIWFSYFVCLLFLSGIFVILVYFSSISKINLMNSKMSFLLVLLLVLFLPEYLFDSIFLGLNSFYYSVFWFMFIYIIFCLLIFMNFTSYYLNFSGALRKL